jgi:hypothetical protein
VYQHHQQYRLPSLLFCILQASPSIKLEIYDVSVFNGVVSTLLPVLSRRLKSHVD